MAQQILSQNDAAQAAFLTDVTTVLTFSSPAAYAGETVTLQMNITNTGETAVSPMTLTLLLPDQLTMTGQNDTWTTQELLPGTSLQYSRELTVAANTQENALIVTLTGTFVHNTASPGILKTMAWGFGTGLMGEALSGGFKGRNATKLPIELSVPEIRPTQWLDPLLNGREINNAITKELRSITRTTVRDISYGVLTDKLLPQ